MKTPFGGILPTAKDFQVIFLLQIYSQKEKFGKNGAHLQAQSQKL